MTMTTKLAVGLAGVCVAFGVAGCAAGAAEQDETEQGGQRDGAIKGAQSAAAFPEGVLIDMMQNGQVVAACSGALIAPRVVLTAAHCVRHQTAWRVLSPALGKQAMADLSARYDNYENGELVAPESHDVGLLHLATPLDLPSYPALADKPLAAGARVVNVGRIHDGQISWDHLFASKPVKVYDASSDGYPFAYIGTEKIESGDSGGPDFVFGSGPHVIAAVNSGGGAGVELLARVDLVKGWITDWVSKHGGAESSGGAGGGGEAGSAKACKHDVCSAGKKLDPSCDPCAAAVCQADAYCCGTSWDMQCTVEAAMACGACAG